MQQGRLKGRALYIGFGSMGAEGLVPEAQRLAKVLLDTAAQSFGFQTAFRLEAKWMMLPVVLMSHSLCEVDQESLVKSHVFCCHHDVPHGWLLARCSVVIHHGGIGTLLAALLAAKPQLVVPVAYDQPFWGQRLEELGLATWRRGHYM